MYTPVGLTPFLLHENSYGEKPEKAYKVFRGVQQPGAFSMPRTCTICRNERRNEIDAALLAGEPLRNIAKHSGTSIGALFRHKRGHLPANVPAAGLVTSTVAAEDTSAAEAPSYGEPTPHICGDVFLWRRKGTRDTPECCTCSPPPGWTDEIEQLVRVPGGWLVARGDGLVLEVS